MEFESRFKVPLPPDQAWRFLLDVPRIAPCLPGAELTEVLGDDRYKGRVSVKLGPVALAFSGTAQLLDIDDAAHTASLKAAGNDTKGRGNANATVRFRIEPAPEGSQVVVRTSLTLAGMVAQYGRGVGMIQAVADQLIAQFVTALGAEITRSQAAASQPVVAAGMDAPAAPSASVPPSLEPAKPISGFALLRGALWASIRRFFGVRE